MKYSVTTYSFHSYLQKGEMDLFDCVRSAHELGFDAIEFTDLPGETQEERCKLAKELRSLCDELSLPVACYAVGAMMYQETKEAPDAEVERVCRQLDVAKLLGAPVMRHDMTFRLGDTGRARSFDLMLPTMAENARRVTEYAAGLGIRTVTENHGTVSQDSERIERLFAAIGHDNFGVLIDMGNFLCADEDSFHAVNRLAPYALHVHAKDFAPAVSDGFLTRGGRRIRGTVIGEGVIPLKLCLRALLHAGYDGYITVEYEGSEEARRGIARGLSNLKKLVATAEE